jgi:hypothetical protein
MDARIVVIVLSACALALGGFIWYSQMYAPQPVPTPSPVAPPATAPP